MTIADELRGWVTRNVKDKLMTHDLNAYADLIEKETVQLPKGSDGEVWHIGDQSECGEVLTLILTGSGWYYTTTMDCHRHAAEVYHHVKLSPAERIRKVTKSMNEGNYSQQGSHWISELVDIACELEGKDDV